MKKAQHVTRSHKHGGDLARTARLFRRYMGGPKVYVVGVLFLVVEAATAVIEPYPIAYIVDYLQGARPELSEHGWPMLVESARYNTILLLTLGIVSIAAVN